MVVRNRSRSDPAADCGKSDRHLWPTSKGSIVGASYKISAKNMDHSLAGMEWRFTNRSNQHIVRDTLLRIPSTDPLAHCELLYGKTG